MLVNISSIPKIYTIINVKCIHISIMYRTIRNNSCYKKQSLPIGNCCNIIIHPVSTSRESRAGQFLKMYNIIMIIMRSADAVIVCIEYTDVRYIILHNNNINRNLIVIIKNH